MKKVLSVIGTSMGAAACFSMVAYVFAMILNIRFGALFLGISVRTLMIIVDIIILFAIGLVGTYVSLLLCSGVYDTKKSKWVLSIIAAIIGAVLLFIVPALLSVNLDKIDSGKIVAAYFYCSSIIVGSITFVVKEIALSKS